MITSRLAFLLGGWFLGAACGIGGLLLLREATTNTPAMTAGAGSGDRPAERPSDRGSTATSTHAEDPAAAVASGSSADARSERDVAQDLPAQDPQEIFSSLAARLAAGLRSPEPSRRFEALREFEDSYASFQRETEESLLAIASAPPIEPAEARPSHWASQELAILLLGRIRSQRALPFLVSHIDEEYSRRPDHPDFTGEVPLTVARSFCAMALLQYGAAAEPAIQEYLRRETSPSDTTLAVIAFLVTNILARRGVNDSVEMLAASIQDDWITGVPPATATRLIEAILNMAWSRW